MKLNLIKSRFYSAQPHRKAYLRKTDKETGSGKQGKLIRQVYVPPETNQDGCARVSESSSFPLIRNEEIGTNAIKPRQDIAVEHNLALNEIGGIRLNSIASNATLLQAYHSEAVSGRYHLLSIY